MSIKRRLDRVDEEVNTSPSEEIPVTIIMGDKVVNHVGGCENVEEWEEKYGDRMQELREDCYQGYFAIDFNPPGESSR